MMKRISVLGLVLMLATVLALPGTARSAMWVGIEGWPSMWLAGADLSVESNGVNRQAKGVAGAATVIGGLTIGYDFVPTGFAGYTYPGWMKYFSLVTDFTYERVFIPNQTVTIQEQGIHFRGALPALNGYMAVWSNPGAACRPPFLWFSVIFYLTLFQRRLTR